MKRLPLLILLLAMLPVRAAIQNIPEARIGDLQLQAFDICDNTASATSVTVGTNCNVVTFTGTTQINTIVGCDAARKGRPLYILCGSAVPFGDNTGSSPKVKLNAAYTCAADEFLVLMCNGTDWVESGRTAGGVGGSSVILDLGDDGGNDSVALSEVAITGDTNSIFTESSADKLLIAVANDWPTCDVAETGDSATLFFTAGTIEHEWGGLELPVNNFSGLVAINTGVTEDVVLVSRLNTLLGNGLLGGSLEILSEQLGVQDVFLRNDADDTTTGNLTVGGTVTAEAFISDPAANPTYGWYQDDIGTDEVESPTDTPEFSISTLCTTLDDCTVTFCLDSGSDTCTDVGRINTDASGNSQWRFGGASDYVQITEAGAMSATGSASIAATTAATASALGADGVDALTEIAQGIKSNADDTGALVITTGAVLTGVHNYGGATSLEVPNGTPTVDTTGEVGVDGTDTYDQFQFMGDAALRAIPGADFACATLESATTSDLNIPLMPGPWAITVRAVGCRVTGTSATLTFEDNVTPTAIDTSVACQAGTTAMTWDSTLSGTATITAGEFIQFDVTAASSAGYLTACVLYTVDPT